MIRRHWIVTCNYCGREHRFNGNTKPTDQQLKESGIIIGSAQKHFCNEKCESEWHHDMIVYRVGNLKQFQPGKIFEKV